MKAPTGHLLPATLSAITGVPGHDTYLVQGLDQLDSIPQAV